MLDQATGELRPGKNRRARVAGLIPVPAEPVTDDLHTALTQRQTLIETAAGRLVDDAQEARAAWVARLGKPSGRARVRKQWQAHAATIALYRHRYDITGPTPLGDPKSIKTAQQAAEYRAAQAALARLRRLSTPTDERSLRQRDLQADHPRRLESRGCPHE
ncbi:hypothetical protein ABT297_05455 [Dactylosporangium sp. NPDC000555]|uniref:hypothetical protein n=1 Tax=Dactylosporangium sp. NPDC000555 TaxID=3154260 RepID=UPI003328AFB1